MTAEEAQACHDYAVSLARQEPPITEAVAVAAAHILLLAETPAQAS